ncbi:MAG: restriction endonuclease [Chlamydiia bacterium]|nr:restriction endonuclease [Chlamydiia bacterium]
MLIIKATGEVVPYDRQKIIYSLQRAGAAEEIVGEVVEETEKHLRDRMHTKELYKIVFKKLKKLTRKAAEKYHLKKAIMELGPTGFPFEKFIAALLESEGYNTSTNEIVQGRCVAHEVDVIAEKGGKHTFFECKYHSTNGNASDIKVALYIYARYLDIKKNGSNDYDFEDAWLATNTRLTSDAEKYSRCVGLNALSWDYPKGNSLRERIDRNGLYPITCLTGLPKRQKQLLLDNHVVLCKSINEKPSILKGIGLSESEKRKILEQSETICNTSISCK